ncbi:MAG: sigma-70 family RNA polymerase sigma factor [Patescibacteria group bacterium]|nr:sigma-70 family RNA polymerase sigma factor [Patescibacteria group bacterium]MDE1943906.1 sigma-70 family RNA polymerase sigma factor [Patescibacteria group bacterium]MDE1944870.1 sigma-70 family RNA polymerase sigma factor [Patescibacteria group bacterium]MDE2057745.1 sigma-70 family RNA polymerase sigma factor [Patescibacteria group bacterium]
MDPSLESRTDEELATAVARNNHDAFGVLMDRYQAKLLRYGRRFLPDPDRAEDAVAEAFLKAYENIKSFDAARRFSPWLYRIAHNTFLDALRRGRREPLALDLDALVAHPSYERDTESEDDAREARELVERGLARLPERYREVLVLYYLESLSYQEIADVLQVPLGTVGVRLARARAALKKGIGDRHHEP